MNEMKALALADQSRASIGSVVDPTSRSKLGQFMTPASVAAFMAGLFGPWPKEIRLLDAGAGLGALTAAVVEEACSRDKRPASIDVTAFEVDRGLIPYLERTLAACESQCQRHNIRLTSRIIQDDFILHIARPLAANSLQLRTHNFIILNPPYAKINVDSMWRRALRLMSIETTNLYTAFLAVALHQLESSGQMVAITPRSFCNGLYFERFREFILEASSIDRVHVYESRRRAFQDDDVLQENIIFRLTKGCAQPSTVKISSSVGPSAENSTVRCVPFTEVVNPNDRHRFIRLPTTNDDSTLAHRVMSLAATLKTLAISVSTGRVVDFRAKSQLRRAPEPGTVPLIYPAHFDSGFVTWPKLGGKKPNALVLDDYTSDQVVPRGHYVLTKRFTSKEEPRRIVAVIYDPDRIDGELVGFENHLNYFHCQGHGIDPVLAKGLAAFLNSTAVDQFFRLFSGHTQVNATDLRNLHYPEAQQLISIGKQIGSFMPEQKTIDRMTAFLFN
jgi:adenine-specific DNA-methyltransferase